MIFDADRMELEVTLAKDKGCDAITCVFENMDDLRKAEKWLQEYYPEVIGFFLWKVPRDV
jgi:hypothetical protein